MKRTRRFLVMILCTFALLGTVGCGNNSADNAADQTMQDKNGTNRKENGNVNDATAGNGNGVMDDAVDDVTDGVEDVTDGITDGIDRAADDLTEDNGVQKNQENTDQTGKKTDSCHQMDGHVCKKPRREQHERKARRRNRGRIQQHRRFH